MHKRMSYIPPLITETQSVVLERLQEGKQGISKQGVQPPALKLTLLPLLLDIEQTMEVLALGKSKIYDLVENEGLPILRLGKSIRFPYKALEQWIEQRMQEIA